MNKMRKKVSLWLLSTFLISRSADVWATIHYSMNLKDEANPLVTTFGLGWAHIYLLVLCALIVFSVSLWRLTFRDYNRSGFIHSLVSRSPLNLKMNIKEKSWHKKYAADFSMCFLLSAGGFVAALGWSLTHEYKFELVNQFFGLKIGSIPLSLVVCVVVIGMLGEFIGGKIGKKINNA